VSQLKAAETELDANASTNRQCVPALTREGPCGQRWRRKAEPSGSCPATLVAIDVCEESVQRYEGGWVRCRSWWGLQVPRWAVWWGGRRPSWKPKSASSDKWSITTTVGCVSRTPRSARS